METEVIIRVFNSMEEKSCIVTYSALYLYGLEATELRNLQNFFKRHFVNFMSKKS